MRPGDPPLPAMSPPPRRRPGGIRAAPAVPLIALISWLFFGQTLDIPALIGLVVTVAGTVVTPLFSGTMAP